MDASMVHKEWHDNTGLTLTAHTGFSVLFFKFCDKDQQHERCRICYATAHIQVSNSEGHSLGRDVQGAKRDTKHTVALGTHQTAPKLYKYRPADQFYRNAYVLYITLLHQHYGSVVFRLQMAFWAEGLWHLTQSKME